MSCQTLSATQLFIALNPVNVLWFDDILIYLLFKMGEKIVTAMITFFFLPLSFITIRVTHNCSSTQKTTQTESVSP